MKEYIVRERTCNFTFSLQHVGQLCSKITFWLASYCLNSFFFAI